jgi:hypothetical protein
MDEVMNELKESIQVVETYLKHLKDTYAEWIQLNSVSFRPTYKKKKPIKRIRVIKPYNIVITHHKDGELKDLLYKGELKNGKGYKDGQLIYEGEFKNDLKHGKGNLYKDEQLIYEGEFKNDLKHGKGKYYIKGKLNYDGEFKNDLKHGKGKGYIKGKLTYEGLWVYDTFIKTNN